MQSDGLEVSVKNEVELLREISNASRGGSIFINATTLELTQTIHLNNSDFTLRGRGMNATTLRCAMNRSRDAALIIMYDLDDLL